MTTMNVARVDFNNPRLTVVRGHSKGHGLSKAQAQALVSQHAVLLVDAGKKNTIVNDGQAWHVGPMDNRVCERERVPVDARFLDAGKRERLHDGFTASCPGVFHSPLREETIPLWSCLSVPSSRTG